MSCKGEIDIHQAKSYLIKVKHQLFALNIPRFVLIGLAIRIIFVIFATSI